MRTRRQHQPQEQQDEGGTRRRRPKRGTILIALGALLVAGAIALTAYNFWDSDRAGQEAAQIEQQLESETGTVKDAPKSGLPVPSNGKMPVKTINGYSYIGTLEVPSLNMKIPIMYDWDYQRLRTAPCRYTGSYWTDDLVICGHNYGSQFSPLRWVDIGADVYFTNVKGLRIHYVVGNRETVEPTSIEQMVENDNNSERSDDWDLTLFTCNLGGQTRCAVRCLREAD